MRIRLQSSYTKLLQDIKSRIRDARHQALRSVNRQLIALYWDIGSKLYEKIEVSKWGQGVIEALAKDLVAAFPGMKGFSSRNLWEMKKLYATYRNRIKLQSLIAEIPWAHHLLILHRTRTEAEREFYLRTCIRERWSQRELRRQLNASLFGRTIPPGKTPKERTAGSPEILEHFKDEYVLDLFELKDRPKEKDLRKALLANLKDFFLEFGRHFTFAGEEYRLNIGGDDFYVDLLLYHRLLRCFVAVELKLGKFKPEYAGKMQFYLAALDEKVRTKLENPSVGIILCKSRNDEVVRIAINRTASPMKIATYRTKLVDRKLLKQTLHSLPAPSA